MHVCFLKLQTPQTPLYMSQMYIKGKTFFYTVIFAHTALLVYEETVYFLFIYHNPALHSENTSHV